MQENEKSSIEKDILNVISDDYHNDFSEIFSMTVALAGAIPEQANNEIRNAMNHLGRASTSDNVIDAEANIAQAKWHISLAKSDCLKIGIIHQANMINELISNIETSTGQILTDLRFKNTELTARRRNIVLSEQQNPMNINEDSLEEHLLACNEMIISILERCPECAEH